MFRISIRDLLLLTLIVALALGWWLDRHANGRVILAPTDDEVVQAWERTASTAPVLAELQAKTLVITKDKVAEYIDPPSNGVATWHNCYKCTIHCKVAGIEEVVYLDQVAFRPASSK